MTPIDKHEPVIDINADIPRWKKILGMYPQVNNGLRPEGENGELEDEGNIDEELEGDQEAEDGQEDADEDFEDEAEIESEDGEPIEELGELDLELAPAPDYKRQLEPLDNREFGSWHEFVESATDETLVGWKGPRSSREVDSSRYGMPWHGTNTWEECVMMATRTGWPEGLKMLEDSLAVVRPRPEPYRSIEMSVAGAFPMVPNYCAGDPECMVIDPGSDMRHSRPVIRIDFNNWTHSGVKPEDMMLRGAAVVSLAETLERHGYSTELRIVGNSRAGETDFRYSIVFKRAGEPMDLDRAAFAIAHPAVMRRLCFAILEQHREAEPSYRGSYGYPLHQANDPTSGKPGGAIYISASLGHETVESARKAVNIAAEELLSEIQTSEESGSND